MISFNQNAENYIVKHRDYVVKMVLDYIILSAPFLFLFPNPFEVIDSLTFYSLILPVFISILSIVGFCILWKTHRIVFCRLDWIIVAFIFYTVIRYAFQENFYPLNEHLILNVSIVLYYFLLRMYRPNIRLMFNVYFLCFFLNLMLAYLSKTDYRVFSSIWMNENTGLYSIYIASFIPVLLWRFYSRPVLQKIFLALLLLLGIVLLLILQSRTAWISTIIGLLLLVLSYWEVSIKKRVVVVGFCIIMLPLMLYGYKKDSSNGRLFIYRNTMDMIADKPVFGHGFDEFKTKYLDYQSDYFYRNISDDKNQILADNTRVAFNDYLQVMSELGLVGMIILIASIITILSYMKPKSLCFICGFSVLIISSLFSYPMSIPPAELMVSTLGAYIINIKTDRSNLRGVYRKNLFGGLVTMFVSLILLLFSVVNLIVFTKWNDAYLKVLTMNDKGFNEYNEIYPIMYGNGGYLFNYGSELVYSGYTESGIAILEKSKSYFNDSYLYLNLGDAYFRLEDYASAERHYIYAATMCPNRFRPLYSLMNLYKKIGDKEAAEKCAKTILTKVVKVPSPEVDRIRQDACKYINEFNEK